MCIQSYFLEKYNKILLFRKTITFTIIGSKAPLLQLGLGDYKFF